VQLFKHCLSQLLNVHEINKAGQIQMLTLESLISGTNSDGVEFAIKM
jgi:hypothetical protein